MRKRRIREANVCVTQNENESKAMIEALTKLEIHKKIKRKDVVVITANWVNKKYPDTADVVGDITLRTIIKFFHDCNPKRIVVCAGSGDGDTRGVMEYVGYYKIIDELGVEFVDLNEGPFTEIKLANKKPKTTKVNHIIKEMTFHVSFTQLKMHEEGTMSASIKNMALSWPPTEEHGAPKKETGIHDDLHSFIVAMGRKIPIDLSIISANPAMVGTGPHNGVAKHTGLILCGTDPVATDTIGARLLGFKPQAVHYLYELIHHNIGQGDTKNINMLGLPLIEAEKIFSDAVYHSEAIVDK